MRATRRSLAAVGLAGLVALACVDCTFLVSFDTRADAGACDGGCGFDATLSPDVDDDVEIPLDVEQDDVEIPPDVVIPADVGDCSLLPEGSPCAKPTACTMIATCKSGSCVAAPVPDGTSCGGDAGGACSSAPACMAGVCVPAMALPDGTACGEATDACHSTPTCSSGACAASAALPDGTSCGTAPNACRLAPACASGVCGAAANAPTGTTCGSAPDDCHDAPTCASGSCGAAATKADGTAWKSGDANALCCGGMPVETTSDTNCGVCGWACKNGTSCAALDGEYICTGCTADSDCASGCCSESPSPNHCSPSNCSGACQSPDVCTGGSHCVVGANLDYCTY